MVTTDVMQGIFALSYLAIIFPVLGSGFVITGHSMYQAWVRRDLPSMGVAAWNGFAQVHNTYQAFRGVPQAWGSLKDVFGGKGRSSSGDGKGGGLLILLLLVALAIIAGILTTAAIIYKYAGTRKLPEPPLGVDARTSRGQAFRGGVERALR